MLCQRRLRQSAYGICRRHFSQHVIRQQQEAMMCPNGRDLDEVARSMCVHFEDIGGSELTLDSTN